ncbi:MAG: cytochrome c biogenesis protein ResB [Thermodesulfobacteriota bacterium]
MGQSASKEKRSSFWEFFSSIRLTIGLLIVLAVVSIAGTLIPQQEAAAKIAQTWRPGLVQFFDALQLFDIYHSVWFRLIIGLLALNLVICSVDRFPATWKLYRGKSKIDPSRPFEDLPEDRTFKVRGSVQEAAGRIAGFLKKTYGHVEAKVAEPETFVFAEKGRTSYFGVYLVHLSVLLILLGGIIGSLLGFEAFVNIPEGETVDTVTLRKTGLPKKLDFSVRCDKFTVDFYEGGAPKEYRSDLTFLAGGQQALNTPVLVNHPVTFGGITFYQASYGTIPGDRAQVRVSPGDPQARPLQLSLKRGESAQLPNGEAEIQVADVRSDFMKLGPAVLIHVRPKNGESLQFWVFQNRDLIRQRFPGLLEKTPKFNPESYKPYVFFLENLETRYYTGLQVNNDPGVPLVWIGCLAMILGFLAAFFTSHKRVWVRVSARKGAVRVSVAGRSHKNRVDMEQELQQTTRRLRALWE